MGTVDGVEPGAVDRAALQLIAEGVTELAGFELAAISIVHDGRLHPIAIAGAEHATPEVSTLNPPVAAVLAELEYAEDWGMLKFVPHEREALGACRLLLRPRLRSARGAGRVAPARPAGGAARGRRRRAARRALGRRAPQRAASRRGAAPGHRAARPAGRPGGDHPARTARVRVRHAPGARHLRLPRPADRRAVPPAPEPGRRDQRQPRAALRQPRARRRGPSGRCAPSSAPPAGSRR